MNEKRIRAEQKELKPLSKKKFVEIVGLRKWNHLQQLKSLCNLDSIEKVIKVI